MQTPPPLERDAGKPDVQPGSGHSEARVTLRPACVDDQEGITRLVREEHLNPNDLHWARFVVATVGDELAGAVQMRRHADGSRELGSLVVRRDQRGHALGDLLIERLLASYADATVHVITRRASARRFARWGFEPVGRRGAPRAIRRNHWLGQVLGGLAALCQGRLPSRLAILRRLPATPLERAGQS